jgi:hypothetical protein
MGKILFVVLTIVMSRNSIQAIPGEHDYKELTFLQITFNCLQLDDLQNDFERLKLESVSQKEIIQTIIEMITFSKKRTHSYVKFYGD